MQSDMPCYFLVSDELGVSSGDGGRTFVEKRGNGRQDFVDLGVCTRKKLTHVKDSKTGSQSNPCYFFPSVLPGPTVEQMGERG